MLIVGGLLTSPFNTFAEDYTSDIESSKSELSQLSERASAISQLLSEKQDELSAISAEIAQLESDRISKMTQEEMAVSELEFLKESIETFEKDIAVMEEEYGKLESLFMERAKVMYQNSDRDLFTIFFESDNIFDFLDKIEVYTKMIKQDKALMEDLKSSRQQLELKKQQQEQRSGREKKDRDQRGTEPSERKHSHHQQHRRHDHDQRRGMQRTTQPCRNQRRLGVLSAREIHRQLCARRSFPVVPAYTTRPFPFFRLSSGFSRAHIRSQSSSDSRRRGIPTRKPP